ncbi:cytochrome P450 [Micromonospora sp. RL09-050-HVF-A]|uniref:cytochrome P450 n=1 Tax=Micromonospora sp. RL09-050-HVF-A TaxID=1703433 RepID=UPI001C5D7EB7|nr:cytochrome P450 [Micromonospora sp. RL09-050-HVF-A]MBW4703742.1 cytochrome P450 [Micromonospora sp. RL09-050-HVF-A]
MTQTTQTDLPHWPPVNPARSPFALLDDAERLRLAGQAVTRVQLPTGATAWLVTRHPEVRQLLRHPAFSSDLQRPGFPLLRPLPPEVTADSQGAFIRMDGEAHLRLRRMLTAEFMIKNVRRIEPLIHQTVSEALADLAAAGPPADFVSTFALPLPSKVICHLLGVPYADHDFFQSRSRLLLNRQAPMDQLQHAAQELREYLRSLIDAKRARPDDADDLLSRLIRERVEPGELGVDELGGMALLLLIAGHETTANMLGLSVLLLTRHPGRYALLRDRPDLAPGMVDELLRYLSIVRTGLFRVATEDVEIGDRLIRAGEGVIALLSLANRDPEVFDDPDGFDPYRQAHQHLAFGFGMHQCIGQPLARAELRVALVELARRFPDLTVAADPQELTTRDNSVVFGLDALPVTW